MARIAAWAGDPPNVEMTRPLNAIPVATWKLFDRPKHGNYAMRKLVATMALLCLSNAVLAHDIYSNLHDRDGNLCCGGQDCKPVKALPLPNGSYYLPESGETIPADMALPSPDERFHHCTYPSIAPIANKFDPWGRPIWEDKPKTRCFFAPMSSW